MRNLFAVLASFAVLTLASAPTFCAGVIYVKWDSPVNGPGTSWNNAYHSVQAGINASTWEQVWVARGDYHERITLKADISLYGGFRGDEIYLNQRDSFPRVSGDPYETILDGDRSGHVVWVPAYAGVATLIDGFTIKNGFAAWDSDEGESSSFGAGIYCSDASPRIVNNTIKQNTVEDMGGGGIFVENGSPVITGNIITENVAQNLLEGYWFPVGGGGLFCIGGSPLISGNTITWNTSPEGAGVYCSGGTPSIVGNRISSNLAANRGGGIRLDDAAGAIVGNTIITNNTTNGSGAGIFLQNANPEIQSNLIFANASPIDGAGINCWNSSPNISNNTLVENNPAAIWLRNSTSRITNNIVAFNLGGGIRNNVGSTPTLHKNDVYLNMVNNYDQVVPGADDISVDPLFVNYIVGDCHLTPVSPCIDAGTNNVPGGLFSTDIDSQPRTNYAIVDIGADEWWGTIIFVDVSRGDDRNGGTSWSDSLQTIGQALYIAKESDRIYVAKGTYLERITLKPGVELYGGFQGNEIVIGQRPAFPRPGTDANATIVDGQSGGSVVTASIGVWTTTILDGFTITHGNTSNGGGINCTSSSPTISNCLIRQNYAAEGGGVYCYQASPTLLNNAIQDNIAINRGGGVHLHDQCYPTIRGNSITGNQAQNIDGGGIFADSGVPRISSNVIANNTALLTGGGVRFWACSGQLTNNTIAKNTAGQGGGVGMHGGSSILSNNIVAFNSTGLQADTGATPSLRNNNVYGNIGNGYYGLSPGIGDRWDDPCFANKDNNDFHIRSNSSCIDTGWNDAEWQYDTDFDRQPRKLGACVDIGADEFWPIIFVKKSGDDSKSGASWADAKKSVTYGLAAASATCEVWVAKGIYQERITLKPEVSLRGGFAGTESLPSQRAPYHWPEPDVNQTSLDGDQLGTVVTSPAGVEASTIVERFVIQDGRGALGGGVACFNSSPVLSVLTILNNYADEGGGVYCEGGSARIEKSVIQGNVAVNRGGGVHLHFVIAPTISDSFITQNAAQGGDGGGIFADSGTTVVARNTIHQNTANLAGGGIRLWGASAAITGNIIELNSSPYGPGIHCHQSSPDITNNTIVGNTATVFGGGVDCFQSSPKISNNIVAFNTGGIYQDQGAPVLRSNDVWGNALYPYWGVLAGVGDIAGDPLFTDRAGRDYHISSASPCYNTGWNSAPSMFAQDIDGQPRVQAGSVDIGVDEVSAAGAATTVSAAKLAANNGYVMISNKMVTAAFNGFFYIEEFGRQSGIRVEWPGHTMVVGTQSTIEGTVRTNSDGERYIDVLWCGVLLGDALNPLTMNNRSVGGGNFAYNPGTGAGQRGVVGGQGLNNIGLLVSTAGKVTYVDPGGQYFTFWDGSGWSGATPVDRDGRVGVRVFAPGMMPFGLKSGSYVEATGAVSCSQVSGQLYPQILARTSADVSLVLP
ncbi:MAG: right-handed parallel beta-helix repeat-containing protein [Armatimonadota bacterium]